MVAFFISMIGVFEKQSQMAKLQYQKAGFSRGVFFWFFSKNGILDIVRMTIGLLETKHRLFFEGMYFLVF